MKNHDKILAFSLILISAAGAQAQQQVEWADKVESVSSQFHDKWYSAQKVLGSPNSMPQGGDNPNAWMPLKDKNGEYIKVSFRQPMKIQQIAVAENYNPGAISKIYAYDTSGREYQIPFEAQKNVAEKSRMLNVMFPMTDYKVTAVKLELMSKDVKGKNQIDAIGISDAQEPIKATIQNIVEVPVDAKMERLSANVNSEYPEKGPLISPDGKTLYFSRANHPQNVGGKEDKEDIWYSLWDPQRNMWGPAANMGEPHNNDSYNFINSITPDGNVLLLGNVYEEDGEMSDGASFSFKSKNGWSFPQPIVIKNDYNKSQKVNYFLNNGGNILISSLERDDRIGGRDLYVSFLGDDGKWSEPKNLGPKINTASEEYAPFLAADDRTLYFSTKGYPTFGGNDIFMSVRIGDGWDDWTEPVNMGRAINTNKDDAYFSLPASGEYAYLTSGGTSDKDTDIYRIALPKAMRPKAVVLIKGRVLDKKTGNPISAKIHYDNAAGKKKQKIGSARSEMGTGRYQVVLPGGMDYIYSTESDGYVTVNDKMDLSNLEEYKEIEKDIYMVPIGEEQLTQGQAFQLNNVFFDFDESVLRPESYQELNRLVKFLEINPNIKIEVAGHTDSVGTNQYNESLSQRRAKAVTDYLSQKGIPAQRLDAKGFGESQPAVPNDTDDNRQQNRRVEFEIIRKDK